MFRRIISIILIIIVVFSLTTMALAADTATVTVKTTLDRANALKDLGIITGIAGFDLTKSLTKTETVVIYLRLLGKDSEAQKSICKNPFKDVPTWASKYIAYAYNKGYTSGTAKTTFGSNNPVTPEQFLTFILRALGYSDKAGDFTAKTVIQKAEKLGIIPAAKYKAGGAKAITRGNCVEIIYSALGTNKKDGKGTLAKTLVDSKAIDAAKAEKYGFYKSTPASTPTPTPTATPTSTPTPQYQMVKVEVKKDAKGDWTIYGTDTIAAVPGAKYVAFNWAGNEVKLGDYTNVYSKDDYQVMVNPNKDAQVMEYLTANWAPLSQYTKFGQDAKIVVTVYDDKANMMAAGIAIAREAITNGYIELALVSVNGAELIAKQNADFDKAFGNPVEYKDAIVKIEKALINWTFISKKTGKVVSTAPASADSVPNYRYVINKTKYPDLVDKTKFFGENSMPSGMSVSDAVKAACLNWFKNNYDGTFNTNCPVSEFGRYSNNWTQSPNEWNNARYIMFADANKKLIAYTQIIPSSIKIVDVGTVDQTAYVD